MALSFYELDDISKIEGRRYFFIYKWSFDFLLLSYSFLAAYSAGYGNGLAFLFSSFYKQPIRLDTMMQAGLVPIIYKQPIRLDTLLSANDGHSTFISSLFGWIRSTGD